MKPFTLGPSPETLATFFPAGVAALIFWVIVLTLLFLVIREENRSAARRAA